MEQQYAQALWQMVANGTAPSKAVRSIKEVLESHGRVALLPRVGRAFARLAERESGKNDVVLTVAHEKDERRAKSEAKKVLEELNLSDAHADLKTQVDDTIVGGWRLEGRGVLVDMSYKSRLLSIYNRVVGA